MAIDQAPANVTASFEALYRGSADAVYAYAASLLRDRSAAEEVTAAAFERAFRKQRSFDPRRGTQRAWLFGIARHAGLDGGVLAGAPSASSARSIRAAARSAPGSSGSPATRRSTSCAAASAARS